MISFSQYNQLNELFDQPVKWEWISKGSMKDGWIYFWKAHFSIPESNQDIIVEFEMIPARQYVPDGNVGVVFYDRFNRNYEDKWEKTDRGNAIKIMATVSDIVRSFLRDEWKNEKWNELEFTGSGPDSDSRIRVYDRMFAGLATAFPWHKKDRRRDGGGVIYKLYKNAPRPRE